MKGMQNQGGCGFLLIETNSSEKVWTQLRIFLCINKRNPAYKQYFQNVYFLLKNKAFVFEMGML